MLYMLKLTADIIGIENFLSLRVFAGNGLIELSDYKENIVQFI